MAQTAARRTPVVMPTPVRSHDGALRHSAGTSDGGRFATELRGEPDAPLSRTAAPETVNEQMLVAARDNLAEERTRFTDESTTIVLEEQLSELARRGDIVTSVKAVPAERYAGNPEWKITEVITADARNLVRPAWMDSNLPESRLISTLECVGDDTVIGTPRWAQMADDGSGFTVDLDMVHKGAESLGVDSAGTDFRRNRPVFQSLIVRRERAQSEYALAAAAVVSERIIDQYPDAATLRFRHDNGQIRIQGVANSIGQPVAVDETAIETELNRELSYSDLLAKPIDASGQSADRWFSRPGRLPFSWEWELGEALGSAEDARRS